jgi:diguanylate cyclase (GGDEF)-like protein/PAS domain S-box-containing protein
MTKKHLIDDPKFLRKIIDSLATPVFIKNRSHEWILVNDAFCELMGKSRKELIYKSDYDFFPKHEADVFWEKDTEVFESRQINTNIEHFTDSNHQKHTIETRKMVFKDKEVGDVLCGVITDITEIQRYQKELSALNQHLKQKVDQRTHELEKLNKELMLIAYVDKLTGLMNRTAFDEKLKSYISYAKMNSSNFALVFFDIDNLKIVNDSYGHPEGDKLIQSFGDRLHSIIGENGDLARVGGDEFMALYRFGHRSELIELLDRVTEQFQTPIYSNNRGFMVSASIGVSLYPNDAVDFIGLTQYADAAMYHAKHNNKGGYVFHEKRFTYETRRKLEMEHELRKALNNNDIRVKFQEINCLKNNSVVGFEALARWNNSAFGSVSPAEFIQIAEGSELILQLGHSVLESAIQFIQSHCLPHQYVSVNVSPIQLKSQSFQMHLERLIQTFDINPSQLVLEVTENVLMELRSYINEFKRSQNLKNIRFFVDDFGTGYSNLAQLKRLDFSALKIDKEFIQDLPESKMDRSLVKTMISMAQELNLEIIAEGVESEIQRDCLINMGCEKVQGFLFSEPLYPEDYSFSN